MSTLPIIDPILAPVGLVPNYLQGGASTVIAYLHRQIQTLYGFYPRLYLIGASALNDASADMVNGTDAAVSSHGFKLYQIPGVRYFRLIAHVSGTGDLTIGNIGAANTQLFTALPTSGDGATNNHQGKYGKFLMSPVCDLTGSAGEITPTLTINDASSGENGTVHVWGWYMMEIPPAISETVT